MGKGNWKLEIFRMLFYTTFPVTMFCIFNQMQYFEDWVHPQLYPPDNVKDRQALSDYMQEVSKRELKLEENSATERRRRLTNMGSWKLEVGRMAIYTAFPVALFFVFNQPKYFEEWVTKTKREIFPPENMKDREDIQKLIKDMRLKQIKELEKD